MKIVIKIGTGSVLAPNGAALHPAMAGIAAEMAQLKQSGHEVILVCSGAVGMGRAAMRGIESDTSSDSIEDKQFYAGVGQHHLMSAWTHMLAPHGLQVMQGLITATELTQPEPSQKLLASLAAAQRRKAIPILNENDVIATDEFYGPNGGNGFSDNDQLASLLARHIGADCLILLTGTDGLYSADPATNPNATHFDVLDAGKAPPALNGSSATGRGGVESKVTSSFAAAQAGIKTIIAHAHRAGVLMDSLGQNPKGTVVLRKNI